MQGGRAFFNWEILALTRKFPEAAVQWRGGNWKQIFYSIECIFQNERSTDGEGKRRLLSIFSTVFIFRAQQQRSPLPLLLLGDLPRSAPRSAIDVVSVRTRLTSENSAHLALDGKEREKEQNKERRRARARAPAALVQTSDS